MQRCTGVLFSSLVTITTLFIQQAQGSILYNEIMNTHICSDWEISSYLNELEDFVQKLKYDADKAKSFANNAVEYVNCEIRNIN